MTDADRTDIPTPEPGGRTESNAADAPEAILQVSGFGKSYREVEAVRNLTFHVAPGEILGMVGPNGAGKTTTMRTIAGILRPTEGTIRAGGHEIMHDPIEAKRVQAYVPDDPQLFDALTVWEHLDFIAGAYSVADFKPNAEVLLERFELTEKRDTIGQELSRGMRQKLAICCAYLHDPTLLMLDEPMTGLDPRGIRTMKQTLHERAGAGAGIIVSSHLLALVEDLCTHLLVLDRGERRFFGSVEDARATIADLDGRSSLEEVFFRITEGDPASAVAAKAEQDLRPAQGSGQGEDDDER